MSNGVRDNQGATIVSFNDGAEAVIVDQLHPPELNQQNVFYAEEAEEANNSSTQHLLCIICRVK
jgi:hypothetical protein